MALVAVFVFTGPAAPFLPLIVNALVRFRLLGAGHAPAPAAAGDRDPPLRRLPPHPRRPVLHRALDGLCAAFPVIAHGSPDVPVARVFGSRDSPAFPGSAMPLTLPR